MKSWSSPRMGNRFFKLVCLMALALAWHAGAQGQSGGLPSLPAVQDEGGAGAAAVAPASPAPSSGAGRFASQAEARDRLREAFSNSDYSAVLGLVAQIREQYPDETFTGYYESTARLQIQESKVGSAKRLFPHLNLKAVGTSATQAQPAATATPAPVSVTPAGTTPAGAQATTVPRKTGKAPAAAPATVPATAPASAPAAAPVKNKFLARLDDIYRDNQMLVLFGGGGSLGAIALGVLLARRRRRATEEEGDAEDLEQAFGAGDELGSAGARTGGNGDSVYSRYGLVDDNTPERPAGSLAAFRGPAQSPAGATLAPGGLRSDWEDDEAPGEAGGLSYGDPLGLDHEPIFTLADAPEPTAAEAGLAHPWQPPQPAAPEDDLLRIDEISFDDDALSPEPEAPGFDPHLIADSLVIDVPPIQARMPVGEDDLPLEADFSFEDDETLRGISFVDPDEETQAGSTMNELTRSQGFGDPETEEFQSFHEDETVTIKMPMEPEETLEDSDRTRVTMEPPVEKEKNKVGVSDSTEDVFDREYKQGMDDVAGRNWVGAIHHLSIAAALRPSAMEVKERLREARRMRAKELEGRG